MGNTYTQELIDIRKELNTVHFTIMRYFRLVLNEPIGKDYFNIESYNCDTICFVVGDKYTGNVFSYSADYFEHYPLFIGGSVLIETPYEEITGYYTIIKCLDNKRGGIEYLIKKNNE